jgi:hypothetical protein
LVAGRGVLERSTTCTTICMPDTEEVSPQQLLGNIDKLMNAALVTSTKTHINGLEIN